MASPADSARSRSPAHARRQERGQLTRAAARERGALGQGLEQLERGGLVAVLEEAPMETAAQRLSRLVVPDPLATSDQSSEARARRLEMALQLSDDGLEMMRANLRRRYPEASEEELGRLFLEWLHDRPGDSWGAQRSSL